jgi:predicted anti-sigma-YlaC factor YlaD
MREQHIVEILDNAPFGSFNENELSAMREHCAECGDCRNAFAAARISSAAIKFESEQAFEPSPFFQTKVIAALREQRGETKTLWDFWRLWQASGSLVTMMIALVAMLMFAVVLAPSHQTMAAGDQAEAVILEQDAIAKDMTNDQVFQALYDR